MTIVELQALKERWALEKRWADHRAAMICTVVANMLRSPKKPAIPIDRFMPQSEPRRPKTHDSEGMAKQVMVLNALLNGKVRYIDGH